MKAAPGSPRAQLPSVARRAGDLPLLLGLTLLVIGAGIGLRDPWGVDEERYLGIALEMLESGEWLIPHRAGEVYADKPPIFMWLLAVTTWLTGSARLAFRLPALLAALGCVALVYDLGRRLWRRRVGVAAALLFLGSVQSLGLLRGGQIDGVLILWTTLGLYGLLRHLLRGPTWGWCSAAWAAMGLGIITKGVGFLPLFVLLPYLYGCRWHARHLTRPRWRDPRWLLGPGSLLAALSVWLGPLVARMSGSSDTGLQAYLRDILLRQTGERLVAAWQHQEPFWYFAVEVIPRYWLPIVAFLPWLVPAWRRRLARRDGRYLLLLGWIVLVVVFFSLSTGKRSLYVYPAVPALALATAPLVPGLMKRLARTPGRRRAVRLAVVLYFLGLMIWGFLEPAALVDRHSRRPLMASVDARLGPDAELGLVDWREGYWLYARHPLAHFGYRGGAEQVAKAQTWLREGPNRWLLGGARRLGPCFDLHRAVPTGRDKDDLYLVDAGMDTGRCTPAPSEPLYRFRWRRPYGDDR